MKRTKTKKNILKKKISGGSLHLISCWQLMTSACRCLANIFLSFLMVSSSVAAAQTEEEKDNNKRCGNQFSQ
jgi:hypothetical protein